MTTVDGANNSTQPKSTTNPIELPLFFKLNELPRSRDCGYQEDPTFSNAESQQSYGELNPFRFKDIL
jgi:hypothetical protein